MYHAIKSNSQFNLKTTFFSSNVVVESLKSLCTPSSLDRNSGITHKRPRAEEPSKKSSCVGEKNMYYSS